MGEVDITIGEINIEASAPGTMTTAEQQNELLRAGDLTCIIGLSGISNPPTTSTSVATTTASNAGRKAHGALSEVFSIGAYTTFALGVVQILLAVAVPRAPRLKPAAMLSREVGMASARFTLGFGASLVLLMAAAPWFVMYVMFLSLRLG